MQITQARNAKTALPPIKKPDTNIQNSRMLVLKRSQLRFSRRASFHAYGEGPRKAGYCSPNHRSFDAIDPVASNRVSYSDFPFTLIVLGLLRFLAVVAQLS